MKFLNILCILLLGLVVHTSAQGCPGSPRTPSCRGWANGGRGGRGCRARTMWHYNANARQCQVLHYWGCRGNNNRWCTRAICEQRCLRR